MCFLTGAPLLFAIKQFLYEGMMARAKRPINTPPGRLRIVAGKWRSRLLPVLDAPGLRPTSERIRETLFNWLGPNIEGASCLDLFGGTGALGIEALSRGAGRVVLVESSARLAGAIRENLHKLQAVNAEVRQEDALDFLKQARPEPFDIVFLDPPFDLDLLSRVCGLLQEKGWLGENAVVYLEQGKDQEKPVLPLAWTVSHEKVAGKVSYSLVSAARETRRSE
jgi:16S rRNA (guanine966-N2)-methyltransferase